MGNSVYIDGCNVAECKHLWKDNSVIDLNFCRINFDNNYFSNGIPCCDKCNKHPDCYFKQLQRAKAELEQYKKSKQASYETMQREWNNAVNELRELKADIEELEAVRALLSDEDKLQAENEKLKENLSEAEAIMLTYKIERDNYKQALEDIRDLNNKTVKIPIITEKINECIGE